MRELKFSIPSDSVYVANDATAYSVTRDLVDSYANMVDIETAIKSRYRLRLERILAEYKRRCINPDDYEFKITIVDGQAVYTLIERRKQLVKTTVRDHVLKVPERKQYTKRPTATLGHPLLQTSPIEAGQLSHDMTAINVRSASDPPREPSTSGSRRRSSSITYRLHLAEASESDLTYSALLNSRCNSPVTKLSPVDSSPNRPIDDEEAKYLDIPCVTLPSFRPTVTPRSKLHHADFSPLTTECESITEDVEGSLSEHRNVLKSPVAKSPQPSGLNNLNKPNKHLVDSNASAVTIYRERQRQFRVYDSDRSVSCHPRRAAASLSKVFPQAIFLTAPLCSPPMYKLQREYAKEPGLRVLPICSPARKRIPIPAPPVSGPSKSRPSASSP